MIPFYAARIEDVGPGDFEKVDCAACSHTALLSPAFLNRKRSADGKLGDPILPTLIGPGDSRRLRIR
jgi:hypothetical protein